MNRVEFSRCGNRVQTGAGIFGGKSRYAAAFEDNYAIPQYAVDEERGVADSLQGIESEDLLSRYGRVSTAVILSEAKMLPPEKRLGFIFDTLDALRPGAGASMDTIRVALERRGTPPGEALARAIDAILQGHAVHNVMSGVDPQLGDVFTDIGNFLGGAAGTVQNTLADMVCSPQALMLLPAALGQRGADPSTARQRLVELQRSCAERGYDAAASTKTANIVVWSVVGVATLGIGWLIWRAL